MECVPPQVLLQHVQGHPLLLHLEEGSRPRKGLAQFLSNLVCSIFTCTLLSPAKFALGKVGEGLRWCVPVNWALYFAISVALWVFTSALAVVAWSPVIDHSSSCTHTLITACVFYQLPASAFLFRYFTWIVYVVIYLPMSILMDVPCVVSTFKFTLKYTTYIVIPSSPSPRSRTSSSNAPLRCSTSPWPSCAC